MQISSWKGTIYVYNLKVIIIYVIIIYMYTYIIFQRSHVGTRALNSENICEIVCESQSHDSRTGLLTTGTSSLAAKRNKNGA